MTCGPSSSRRIVNIRTPWRTKSVQRLARRSYKAAATSLLRSPILSRILREVIRTIKLEIKHACSATADSLLTQSEDALKEFSWDKIGKELDTMLPTLTALLRGVVRKTSKKPVIYMICSILLKQSYSKMSLVQRAVSVLLYAASKQVTL